MSYYIKNKGQKHAWILKHQLSPGETLDLDEVFKGFCKPKPSTRGEAEPHVKKFSEFKENEFDDFMEWVREEIMLDRATFEIVDDSVLPKPDPELDEKSKKRRVMSKAKKASGDIKVRGWSEEALGEARATYKQLGKKLPSEKDLSPKEIAWLPADGMSRKIIEDIDDIRRLKTAFRLVRNISGQERTRKMIEDRINELQSLGG